MNQLFSRAVGAAALATMTLVVFGCDDKTASSTSSSATTNPSGAKTSLVVGFSQVGAESAWRTAHSESIKAEAAKRGIDLKFADAQQKQENQLKAIQSFITQQVDVIAFSPVVESGWDPVLADAKKAGIPVVLSDRRVKVADDSLVTCFVGTDATNEGRLAGQFLADATNGKATIAELEGTPGSDPAILRKNGFHEVIDKHPDMHVIKAQTGDFTRAKGREVMEAFLKSPEGPSIDAVFAHNDDMALGAIQAIEAAGKKPGVDIKIVSIDGVRDAFQAMVDGKLNATVECSPLLGPAIFDVIEKVQNKQAVPKTVINPAVVYTQKDAKDVLPTRKY